MTIRKSRIFVFIGVLGLIGWGAYEYASQGLENAFLEYIKTEKDEGTLISYEDYSIHKGILNLALIIRNPSLEAPETWVEKASLQGDLKIQISLLSPQTIQFFSHGKTQIFWKSPDPSHPISLESSAFQGQTSLTEFGRLDKTDVEFTQGQLFLEDGKKPLLSTDGGTVAFKKIHESRKFKFHLTSKNIVLNPEIKSPFGSTIEDLELEASISDLESHRNFKDFLQGWFDASGTAEVKNFKFKWGTLDIDSQGTFTVDENLQPLIALTAKVKNMDSILQALVEKKLISQKSVPLVKLVLAGIGSRIEDHSLYKVSLTLQEGELSLGPVPLLRGLTIKWG